MKAHEYRIGNIVMGNKPFSLKANDIALAYNHEKFKGEPRWKDVPLTEEWLLKFGFEKLTEKGSGFKSTSYTYTGKVALIVHFDGVRLSVNFWQGNEKKYVHQLQNLYFALTGEELTLKEKQR